jgi:uncharacterized protein
VQATTSPRHASKQKHRVLFGSNHPFWPPGDCLSGFDDLGLDKEPASLFLAENAKRVFKLNRI